MIYNEVINNLQKLKLDKMSTYLSTYLDEINKNSISFIDALYELTNKEIEFKEQRASEFNIKVAGYRVEILNLYQNIISAEKLE